MVATADSDFSRHKKVRIVMVGVTTKQTKEDAVRQENDVVDGDQQEPFDPVDERQEPLAQSTRLGALPIFLISSCTINLLSFSTSLSMARHHCRLSHILRIYS